MTVSTQASREAGRLERRTKQESAEILRDAALEHVNARQRRLQAYVESLRVAVRDRPGPDRGERLERLLVRAQRDAEAASKQRVPLAGTSAAALIARTPVREPLAATPPELGPLGQALPTAAAGL